MMQWEFQIVATAHSSPEENAERLTELGGQGWEAVSHDMQNSFFTCLLKRTIN